VLHEMLIDLNSPARFTATPIRGGVRLQQNVFLLVNNILHPYVQVAADLAAMSSSMQLKSARASRSYCGVLDALLNNVTGSYPPHLMVLRILRVVIIAITKSEDSVPGSPSSSSFVDVAEARGVPRLVAAELAGITVSRGTVLEAAYKSLEDQLSGD